MSTIVFFPEGAFGPTNNCVGIANVLKARGHRVVFVVEESFEGTLAEKGFEERLMRLGPAPEQGEAPGQFWKDFVRDTGPVFKKPTLDQLEGFMQPTWQALIDGSMYVDERLGEIFAELEPDVIVEDNVVGFPAVVTAEAPWVRIVSCNPLELRDPDLPPTYSGYALADRAGWDEFIAEYHRTHDDMHAAFDEWVRSRGCPPLGELDFIHESPDLNLYVYPDEADYPRARALGDRWQRLDSCVRAADSDFELPPEVADGTGRLIYLSLGSLGSADVELMQRLVDALALTEHRVIVSKGPQHDQIELRERMWGEELVPQPGILPQVDLVITHGGNNTVTESWQAGKPMIVLPLFWDQHDNAQRVQETGLGARLPTFMWDQEQLAGAIDALLGDAALGVRLQAMSERLRASPGPQRAAGLIEAVAAEA